MRPLWNHVTREVYGESGCFAGAEFFRLMFPARRILRVSCPATGMEFLAERDFSHVPGSNCISRPAESRIPLLTKEALYPSREGAKIYPEASGPESTAIEGGPDGGLLLFNNAMWFAEHQVEVDYEALALDFPPFSCRYPDRLPRVRDKIRQGMPFRITALGDSITEGFNASGYHQAAPYQGQYVQLVADALGAELRNRGVNGAGAELSLQQPEKWLADQPDLLVVAYGMNHFLEGTPERYLENLRQIFQLARKNLPETDILFIASMSGNPEWRYTPAGSDRLFANALREFVLNQDSCCSLVDQSELWAAVLRRKGFFDLTGNGVNHPNDYGHRLLAANILSELTGKPFAG